ncbi:magnesium chelatase [Candidatus Cerribacteria bacterium 'Amazon FNV 2010 28 9']|uniref:Magnesium chelatase n=1 Tax=Candidatus Cerribacteria bacterium 'Amazon FNV 2010 28 9' TaxID=2081795 RepID=A0A317JPN0_9BACT|nr:MAG: magnesium chelatase [Candidatus Cerribacteria bacterium 'Amazon FNV 2010 28 9']
MPISPPGQYKYNNIEYVLYFLNALVRQFHQPTSRHGDFPILPLFRLAGDSSFRVPLSHMNPVVKINSGSLYGIDAKEVHIEVGTSGGNLPHFDIVGLGDKAIDEARERVKSAIRQAGFQLSAMKIVVNLTPAYIQKQGTQFDLGIALGLLASQGDIPSPESSLLYIGELSLNGDIQRITGALPFVLLAKKLKLKGIVFPYDNLPEVASVTGIALYPVKHLKEVIQGFTTAQLPLPFSPVPFEPVLVVSEGTNFADIHGQEIAKRALEIAAAGGHNILLSGVPGAGKTLMARSFVSIMPPLTEEEALELTQIYSVASALGEDGGLVRTRPFRSPHHTTSLVGLIGGGSKPKPGEISLAHRGVLFLDEFAEFPRIMLESLRQPLEDGHVSIARASGSIRYPSRFTLIAAVNPCPCGYKGSRKRQCSCSPQIAEKYQKRLSGPILDRIDLHVHVQEVEIEKLAIHRTQSQEDSKTIQARVIEARKRQLKRLRETGTHTNAELTSKQVKILCTLSDAAQAILLQATERMNLSTRVYFKMIKVAQTIADLEGAESIQPSHISEALSYRPS